ncbi:MAG: sigma 54-interacting transcriptional regulator [Verrucomicrobiota bacterium]
MDNDDRLALDPGRPATVRRLLVIDDRGGLRRWLERTFDPAEVQISEAAAASAEVRRRVSDLQPDAIVVSSTVPPLPDLLDLPPLLPLVAVALAAPDLTAPSPFDDRWFDRISAPIDQEDFRRRLWVALKAAQDGRLAPALTIPKGGPADQELLVGPGAAMQSVLSSVSRLTHSDAPVLIEGETGTGKDLLARLIHHQSGRRARYFITIDCHGRGDVLERELFGDNPEFQVSRLRQAAGGTLFLQHVDRLPLSIQTKLLGRLRAAIPPAGEGIDVRLIAGATGNLEAAVAARAFREDLLALLGRVRIALPPLRERLEDIPHLASYFLNRFVAGTGQAPKSLSAIVSYVLARHQWLGNIRQLQGVLQRAAAFACKGEIELGDLPADFLSAVGSALLQATAAGPGRPSTTVPLADLHVLSGTLFQWARKDGQFQILPAIERELIIHAMAETGGNQVQAAKLLGITRATLRKRLHRFNIQRRTIYSAPTLVSGFPT